MQCEFFAILVDELVREHESNTGLVRRLLNHARECLECGRRLSEAKALTESLRAVAATDAGEQAPDRVEEALLGYLRQRRRNRFARLWERKWVATAAGVCLVAVGLAVWPRHRPEPARNNPQVITAPSIPATPRNLERVEVAARTNMRTTSAAAAQAVPAAESGEYSGFIPLPYGEGAASLSGGQIVRVEVARSALASMGFPVTGATSDSYVDADVLIGEDGMARAIRFEPQVSDSSR